MFCSKCGTFNNDDSGFCVKCGSRLVLPDSIAEESRSRYQHQPDSGTERQPVYYNQSSQDKSFIVGEPEEKNKKKRVLICFFIVNAVELFFLLAVLRQYRTKHG